jgi:hypothetical protein
MISVNASESSLDSFIQYRANKSIGVVMLALRIASWSIFIGVILIESCQSTLAEDTKGSRSLFNGQDLAGWKGDPRFWRVEHGELIGETTDTNKADKNTFLIFRGGEFADFDLSFKYQVVGFNSGIQYRSKEVGQWSVSGYQADFEGRHHKLDDRLVDRFSGMFFEEQGRMFMGQRGQAVIVRSNVDKPKKPRIEVIGSVGEPTELEKVIKRDGWNEMRIVARGYTFFHFINGQAMCIALDEDIAMRSSRGLIAFQLHAGPPMQIKVKDLLIQELDQYRRNLCRPSIDRRLPSTPR